MTPEEIKTKLAAHALWIAGDPAGVRADFHEADLTGADLRGVDLRGAYLREANLTDAILHGAILHGANLREANLTVADLRGANLRGADLRWANLRHADLTGADLTDAILAEANFSGAHFGTHTVGKGRHATFNLSYWAMTTVDGKGRRWIQYGCETHLLDDWEVLAGDLAKKHQPTEAARYEDETRALVALCRTMDTEEETQ